MMCWSKATWRISIRVAAEIYQKVCVGVGSRHRVVWPFEPHPQETAYAASKRMTYALPKEKDAAAIA
jgi:hypothetical protein